MTIHILSPEVAAQIAAGEVVERPANVVKELVENSLDAGATDIRVEIREGGQRLLRITDNGHGMTADEAPLALARHATSKLSTVDDLNAIRTFGFRGEALYSIAAVSQMTLVTRHQLEPFAIQLRVTGGQIVQQGRAGAPVGTMITVEQLFYNVPARQKFLRKATTEAGQVSDVIQRYALAYPDRRFSLVNEGKLVFQSTGSGDLVDVLAKLYGLEQAKLMTPLGPTKRGIANALAEIGDDLADEVEFMTRAETAPPSQTALPSLPPPMIQVQGYVSLPALTRPNRSNILLFVNRRFVEDRTITHAVVQAYHTLLPVGRYPLAVVLIEIDPSQIDVNVHPQKTQVRFVDERLVFGAVQKAVRRAVITQAPPPELVLPAPMPEPWSLSSSNRGWSNERSLSRPAVSAAVVEQQPLDLYAPAPKPSPASVEQPTPAAPAAALPTPAPLEPPAERTPALTGRMSQLPPLRVVGQVGAMYIIAEGPEGMYLIDQHAAHERILYEKLMAQRYNGANGGDVARQQLLQPLTLHVGSALAGQVAHYLDELNRLGFVIEPFGSDTFLVRAVPSVLSGQDPLRNLEEMVNTLADRRNLVGEELEARLVKLICKRASIKAGQLLSDLEMQELIHQLEECQSPRTCPHGRPTMIQLAASELEKAFGRV